MGGPFPVWGEATRRWPGSSRPAFNRSAVTVDGHASRIGWIADRAHFSAMSAAAGAALGRDDAAVIGQVGRHYDDARHGLPDAAQTGGLDDEFADRFAVVGPAAQCAARLHGLFELGWGC